MRHIILTFKESEYLWYCADSNIHPSKMTPAFTEVLRDRLGSMFNAKIVVRFDEEFSIFDTAGKERNIEEALNDLFFWMEDTYGWQESTKPLHSVS